MTTTYGTAKHSISSLDNIRSFSSEANTSNSSKLVNDTGMSSEHALHERIPGAA
jgi:hypothetical protein